LFESFSGSESDGDGRAASPGFLLILGFGGDSASLNLRDGGGGDLRRRKKSQLIIMPKMS
jgi:hypothetical protein